MRSSRGIRSWSVWESCRGPGSRGLGVGLCGGRARLCGGVGSCEGGGFWAENEAGETEGEGESVCFSKEVGIGGTEDSIAGKSGGKISGVKRYWRQTL